MRVQVDLAQPGSGPELQAETKGIGTLNRPVRNKRAASSAKPL